MAGQESKGKGKVVNGHDEKEQEEVREEKEVHQEDRLLQERHIYILDDFTKG
jgi:hypothetical protein